MKLDGLPDWLRNPSCDIYNSDNYVVVDFETTIIDKGSPYEKENSIVCASYRLGTGHSSYEGNTSFVVGNEYEQEKLIKSIEKAEFFVAHNSKFEYGWLERCGLDIAKNLAFCTMIAEYVISSNRRWALSLDSCLLRRHFKAKTDIGKKLLRASVCPSTWPLEWLRRYSIQDTIATEKLFLAQRAYLVKHDKLKTAFTRNIFTPVLMDMEKRGMHIDKERVLKVHRDYVHELLGIELALGLITGGANPSSPKQMREVIYTDLKFKLPKDKKHYTGKGEPTTSYSKYLITLKPKNKKQETFLQLKNEYSKVNAALTKCLNKFTDCVVETTDHILTASLNQTVTATQRLSSTGKNYGAQFQNFPVIFKPLFSARHEGWYIGEIDQAQLEYRVAVWYGQDAAGLEDIKNCVDAHAYTASHIYGDAFTSLSKEDPVRKELRNLSKAHTFKPLYGGKSGTPDEVRYYEAFQAKHTGITKVQNEWKMEALNTGKVRCPNGLDFYFPGTKVTRSGYITNSTNICNYHVQSLATADIVPISVVYQWHLMRLRGLNSYCINTIHDSVIMECHPDELEIIKEIGELSGEKLVKQYMKKIYGIEFNVPLEVEIQFAKNWNDTQDWQDQYLN